MSVRCNLVLSGGGVRGYAHIGALKALYEKGIVISAISGTSCGAMVGAFICDGYHPSEIEEILLKHKLKVSMNFMHFKDSLLSFDAYAKILRRYLRTVRLENFKIPLFVSATDLNTGRQKIFSKGNVIDCLIASSAIPVLFTPVLIGKVPYADGGMSNNLPVEPFVGKKTRIIGIHVNPVQNFSRRAGLVQNIDRSMHIIVGNNIRGSIKHCDVFIEPPELDQFHVLDTAKAKKIIDIGYDFVKKKVVI
jgi:NTE family protein